LKQFRLAPPTRRAERLFTHAQGARRVEGTRGGAGGGGAQLELVGNVVVTRMVAQVRSELRQAVSAVQRDGMSLLMLSDLEGARHRLGTLRRMGPELARLRDAPDAQRAALELERAIERREEETRHLQRLQQELDANRDAREAVEQKLQLLERMQQERNQQVRAGESAAEASAPLARLKSTTCCEHGR
jgi:hypothetical protein